MDNLKEPHFEPSSVTPGCSGESENAPYGPKAVCEDGIMATKNWGNTTHDTSGDYGWSVGKTTGLSEPMKEKSMLQP